MIYGYARVSTKEQKLDRQIEEFKKFGIDEDNIYYDKQSGKDFDRIEYKKLISKIKAGDLLVIKSIDRLGRNYDMIINEWSHITKKLNCDIVVLDMDLLDTRSDNKNLVGKFISDIVLQILSFVAEQERKSIKQRQAEGIYIAKQKGIVFGRPKIELPSNFYEISLKYLKKELTIKEALKKTGMKKSSFYKYLKNVKK